MTEQEMRELRARQEDAKRRVMEMQSRSRFAAEQMRKELGEPSGETLPPPEIRRPAGEGRMDREELERLFLLSLCLLLSQEEADRSVILGLMYLLT